MQDLDEIIILGFYQSNDAISRFIDDMKRKYKTSIRLHIFINLTVLQSIFFHIFDLKSFILTIFIILNEILQVKKFISKRNENPS